MKGAFSLSSSVSKMSEPSEDDLLDEAEDAADGADASGSGSSECNDLAEDNIELLSRVVALERLSAEQDSRLGELRRAVSSLRQLQDQADAPPESTCPTCKC